MSSSNNNHNRKIVILTPLEPTGIGGIEKVVKEFAVRLKARFDLEIVCSGTSSTEYDIDGVPVHVAKGQFGSFAYAPRIAEVVRKLEPSLLYVHDYSSYLPYLAARLKKEKEGEARNNRIKLVLHAHFHPSGSSTLSRLIRRFYDPVIGSGTVKAADAIIANSKSELSAIRHTFSISEKRSDNNKKFLIVPNGIDLDAIQAAEPFRTEDGIIPVFSAGRLVGYKNPAAAVKVILKLPAEFRLYIAGKGPMQNELASLIRKECLEDRVKLLGFVRDEDVLRWYKTAHVFLHLSDFESFGLTCVEALAAGTPSVANDDGFGLSDTIDLFPKYITRCSVKKQTSEEIAKLVQKTATLKPVRADVSEFGWDALTERLANAFDQILFQYNDSLDIS